MKIKVIGKREGVSKKSGKPYVQVSYLEKMNGGEGQVGNNLWLDPKDYDAKTVVVGKEYNAEFNSGGFLVSFAPAN